MTDLTRPVTQSFTEQFNSVSLAPNAKVSIPVDGFAGIQLKPKIAGPGTFTYTVDATTVNGPSSTLVNYNNNPIKLDNGVLSPMLTPTRSLTVQCSTSCKLDYWTYVQKGQSAGEFGSPQNQPITMISFLAMAAAGTLVAWQEYNVSGIPYRALDGTNYICLKGDGTTFPSDEVLLIDASTGERSHALNTVSETSISITNQTDGSPAIVTYRTNDTSGNGSAFITHVGMEMRLASLNNPSIECSIKVTATSADANGRWITGRVLRGIQVPNVVNGVFADGSTISTNGGTMTTHSSLYNAAAGWTGMASMLLGGRVRFSDLSTSGSNLEDWVNVPSRVAQIRSRGRVGGIVINLLNNSINAAGFPANYILQLLEKMIQICRLQTSNIYIMMPGAASSENQSSPKLQANTSMYTSAWLTIMGARQLIRRYPECKEVQVGAASMQNYGQTNTTDVVNGYAVFYHKFDDGIHNLWGEAMMWAHCLAYELQKDFPFKPWQQSVQPFNVFNNSALDSSGAKLNNIAENFYGAVPATGGIPNSCSVTASGTNGMTATHNIAPNPDGGSDWVTTINSNGNTGVAASLWTQIYSGTSGSLLTQLNLAENRGVPIEVWWDGGLMDVNERSIQIYELVLEIDIGDGLGFLPVTGYSTLSMFQAGGVNHSTDGSKGDMDYGYWGRMRLLPFTLDPSLTIVGARVRQSVKIKNGADPGTFSLRMGADPLILVEKYTY